LNIDQSFDLINNIEFYNGLIFTFTYEMEPFIGDDHGLLFLFGFSDPSDHNIAGAIIYVFLPRRKKS